MKRLVLCVLLVAATIALLGFVTTFEVGDWRNLSGPFGSVQVDYTIAEKGPLGTESTSSVLGIAGSVEKVQFVPDGEFVVIYIKTTEGWYESPRSAFVPVDWERGVEVAFTYREGTVLRKQTRLPIQGFYPAFGSLRWRGSPFGFGNQLDEGDIASVHFRNAADGTQVTVRRTNGLKHSGYQSWEQPGMAVEVTVFDK